MEGPLATARISAAEAGRAPCNTTPPGKSCLSAEMAVLVKGGNEERVMNQNVKATQEGGFDTEQLRIYLRLLSS